MFVLTKDGAVGLNVILREIFGSLARQQGGKERLCSRRLAKLVSQILINWSRLFRFVSKRSRHLCERKLDCKGDEDVDDK